MDTVADRILRNAIKYLEPFGEGRDLEYARARWILQYALASVHGETLNA